MAVKKVMCACGSGIGSSLIVRMNAEAALKKMGRTDIEVFHSTTSDAQPGAADVFIVGKDLEEFVHSLKNIITLDNIASKDEVETKLRKLFDDIDEPYTK